MIKMTVEDYHCNEDNYIGLCLSCGAEKDSCEPDARKYLCDDCGAYEVYGTSELLIMGKIEIIEE